MKQKKKNGRPTLIRVSISMYEPVYDILEELVVASNSTRSVVVQELIKNAKKKK